MIELALKDANSGGHRPRIKEFFYKHLLPAVALSGLAHWVAEFSPLIASIVWLLTLVVFLLGLKPWCNTARKKSLWRLVVVITVLLFLWLDRGWLRRKWTPTFVYLVPTHELIGCKRRAFFINQVGFTTLQNLEIVIKDNKSGTVQQIGQFKSGLEPGPQDPDTPRYVWVKTSHPWDEDYTIAVSAKNYRSVQRMVLRSVNEKVQFAVQVTLNGSPKAVLSCQDRLLPKTYSLARDSINDCGTLMAEPASLTKLEPIVQGFQRANGDYVVLKKKELPPSSDLDSQSETRHLTEYQQAVMKTNLSKYRGTRTKLFYSGGPRTRAYALEFTKFLRSIGWRVEGPTPSPKGNERLVDIQVSVSNIYWNHPFQPAFDLLGSLGGIKHRRRYVYDDAIPPDVIILWFGPKSPENFTPDACAPAALHPRPGEHHTCELVAQTTVPCPFPPR